MMIRASVELGTGESEDDLMIYARAIDGLEGGIGLGNAVFE